MAAEGVNTPVAPPAPAAAAEPPKPPAQPVVEPPKPSEDPKMAERYAALARQEKVLLKQRQEAQAQFQQLQRQLAEQREELKRQQDAIKSQTEEAQTWQTRIKQAKADPGGFLKTLYGEDWYDTLTNYQMGEGKPASLAASAVKDELLAEVNKTREELANIRKAQEEERKQQLARDQERQQREVQQVRQQVTKEIVDFVKGNEAQYPLTSLYGRQDLVLQVIEQTYEATKNSGEPRIVSYEEATKEVEKYLLEQVERYEKWKQAKAPAKTPDASAQPPKPESPTLNNGMGAEPSPPSVGGTMPKDERMRRALEAWQKAEAERKK